jgi:hypothetical protein
LRIFKDFWGFSGTFGDFRGFLGDFKGFLAWENAPRTPEGGFAVIFALKKNALKM